MTTSLAVIRREDDDRFNELQRAYRNFIENEMQRRGWPAAAASIVSSADHLAPEERSRMFSVDFAAAIDDVLAAAPSTRVDWRAVCSTCHDTVPAVELKHVSRQLASVVAAGSYCPKCLPAMQKKFDQEQAARLASRGIKSALARARAEKVEATLTPQEWKATLKFFNHSCAYCGGEWYIVEHVVPLRRGGGTTKSNCVPACFTCNNKKGNQTAIEWLGTEGKTSGNVFGLSLPPSSDSSTLAERLRRVILHQTHTK